MPEYAQMPINIKVEKAKNEMRYGLNAVRKKYDLPGCIMDLVLDSIRAEECQQRISLTAEQITEVESTEEAAGEEKDGITEHAENTNRA